MRRSKAGRTRQSICSRPAPPPRISLSSACGAGVACLAVSSSNDLSRSAADPRLLFRLNALEIVNEVGQAELRDRPAGIDGLEERTPRRHVARAVSRDDIVTGDLRLHGPEGERADR